MSSGLENVRYENLRWVLYNDMYHVAYIAPEDESPALATDNNRLVCFVSNGFSASVPSTAIEPFDANIEERLRHPSAATALAAINDIMKTNGRELMVDGDNVGGWLSSTRDGEERKRSEEGTAGAESATKKTETPRIIDNEEDDDEDEDETTSTEDSDSSGSIESSEVGSSSGEEEEKEDGGFDQGHWDEMEKSLGITRGSKGKRGPAAGKRVSYRGFSTASEKRSRNYDGLCDGGAGSPVAPFIAEINYHYRVALEEAKANDSILNLQQPALIRVVEMRLVALRAEIMHMRRLVRDWENRDGESPEIEALANLRKRLEELENSFSVQEIIKQELHMEKIESKQPEKKRITPSTKLFSFVDASFGYLLDAACALAPRRDSAVQLLSTYSQQRRQRESFVARQQGLGKLGFAAPRARVMENWRRSREMIVLDPMRGKRPVARRFSQTLSKVDKIAMECYEASSTAMGGVVPKPRRPATIYNFNDLRVPHEWGQEANRGAGGGSMGSSQLVPEPEAAVGDLPIPAISPLKTNFDPRATFVIDANSAVPDSTAVEQHDYRSVQCSQTLRLPSQESMWVRSEAHDSDGPGGNEGSQHVKRSSRVGRSLSRGASMSRASSRASSVARDMNSISKRSVRSKAGSDASGKRALTDWRGSAKRVILEQLTLYLRGLRGRPAVLTEDHFAETAKKLLERAVAAESERKGISLSLQSTNLQTTLDKSTETRLRKSVDHYVLRHFMGNQSNSRRKSIRTDSEGHTSRGRSDTQVREPDGEDSQPFAGEGDHDGDSPVYDQ